MKQHIIPVAFEVSVEDHETEMDAAAKLARALHPLSPDGFVDERMGIESWWMPNHPSADGSDNEAVLLWVPMMSYAGRVTKDETPQQSVDGFFKTMARWTK